MRHLTIGVDPGLHGGIAILEGNEDTPLVLLPMPIHRPGKKGRDQYDVDSIVQLMRRAKATGSCVGVVEKLHPLPAKIAKGVIANYNRGAAFWFWVAVFGALRIPLLEAVLPRVWQKEMLAGTPAGDTKQRSVIAAQRLFPGVSLLPTERSRKPSDGLSDALLIAEFGRRRAARVWDEAGDRR